MAICRYRVSLRSKPGPIVADLDRDGVNDFVLSFRQKAPALVWYRRNPAGWSRYVIEKEYLTVEAGGAVYDIDGDGYPDIVFGADYQGDQVWWWRNPGGHYDPDVSWERHTIKRGGSHQHHDQIFGDFKGTGRPQLVFWNQGAKKLFIADIPSDPRHVDQWPMEEIYSGSAGEGPGKYAEGLAAIDIDGDGKIDLLAGNYWFKYERVGRFRPIKIADVGGRVAAGRFIKGARYPQVVINSGDAVAPLKWYACRGDPEDPKSWIGHDLVGRDVIHGTASKSPTSTGMGTSTSSPPRWQSGPRADPIPTILMPRRGSFTVMAMVISAGRFFHAESTFTRPASQTSTATVCSIFSISRTTGRRAWTYGCRCALVLTRPMLGEQQNETAVMAVMAILEIGSALSWGFRSSGHSSTYSSI